MMSVGTVLLKRLRVDGFLLLDYASRFLEAATELGQWKMFGKNQRPRDHRGKASRKPPTPSTCSSPGPTPASSSSKFVWSLENPAILPGCVAFSLCVRFTQEFFKLRFLFQREDCSNLVAAPLVLQLDLRIELLVHGFHFGVTLQNNSVQLLRLIAGQTQLLSQFCYALGAALRLR